jgi:serine/threonine protein kinase
MMLTVNPSKRSSAQAALEHAWMRRKEKELKDRYLSVTRLRESVVKDRNRHQGLGEANPADRIGNLNRQYESYLTKRSDSMTVFTKQSVVSHVSFGKPGVAFSFFVSSHFAIVFYSRVI